MPSTLAQTATILAVGRKPSGESRAFSALDRAACAATATKVDGIGRWVAVSNGRTAELWDLHEEDESPAPLLLTGHRKRIESITISRDSRWLVTTSKAAKIWDLTADDPSSSPREVTPPGHGIEIGSSTISSDCRWLFTAGGTNSSLISRWDLTLGEPASSPCLLRGHHDGVVSLAISQDGHWLVSGSHDGTARLWNLEAAEPSSTARVLRGHDRGFNPGFRVAIHPLGYWIATASNDGTVRLWDLRAAAPTSSPFVLAGHEDISFSRTAISSDGRWIATTTGGNAVQLWDTESRDPSLFSRVLPGHEDRIESMAISNNDRWLATGSEDGTARLWDLTSRDPASSSIKLETHSDDSRSTVRLAIDPTSRWLATTHYDHKVRLWDLEASNPAASPRVLSGHESPVISLKVSPDGRWLATGAAQANQGHTARLWDLRAKDPQTSSRVLGGHEDGIGRSALSFDGNGRWLAIATGVEIWFWDLKADLATSPRIFPTEDWPHTAALSPNGRWLFMAGYAARVRLWDLNTKNARLHEQPKLGSQSVAISPDSHWLATTNRMNVQLWDLTSPEPMSTARFLRGHRESIWQVKISADSRWLITDASDGTVRRWNLDLPWLLDYARRVAGRELTDEERQQYGIDAFQTAPSRASSSGLGQAVSN